MKTVKWAALGLALAATQAWAADVTWTLAGPSQVDLGQPVAWEAAVEVIGANQGLAGYAFNIVIGPGAGPNAGTDGQWGTQDDQNLANVQLPPAQFNSIFQVAGSSPPPGSVEKTGATGGPGMNVLPQAGTGTLIPGELLQVGASYIDWAAFPGQNGQTPGVGVAARKPALLATPGAAYTLHSGTIPTAGLPAGVYTISLIPVATRTLRVDLDYTQNHQGFIMQSATATGSSFTLTIVALVIPGDFNDDGDVDADDLAIFNVCVSGPTVSYTPTLPQGCNLARDGNNHIEADFDADGDVDQDDFGVYQRCYSGTNVPGNPSCAD